MDTGSDEKITVTAHQDVIINSTEVKAGETKEVSRRDAMRSIRRGYVTPVQTEVAGNREIAVETPDETT